MAVTHILCDNTKQETQQCRCRWDPRAEQPSAHYAILIGRQQITCTEHNVTTLPLLSTSRQRYACDIPVCAVLLWLVVFVGACGPESTIYLFSGLLCVTCDRSTHTLEEKM